jgi:hypothetical protein
MMPRLTSPQNFCHAQLEAMTKKELLRVARKYSLEIQRPEDLSNRQVRIMIYVNFYSSAARIINNHAMVDV